MYRTDSSLNAQINDALFVVSLSDNLVIPFAYSSQRVNMDVDRIERNVKPLSEIYTEVNENSKPFLAKIHPSTHLSQSSDTKLEQCHSFAIATNDGHLMLMNARPIGDCKFKANEGINADNIFLEKKNIHAFDSTFFQIASEPIHIKLCDLNKEQTIVKQAIILSGTDGVIYFYVINDDSAENNPYIPKCFKFGSQTRLKGVKVGRLRLYGRAEESTQCLFVFTYEDFAMVFYDFVFEVNTQHITFKNKMNLLVKRGLINMDSKKIKNPILQRIVDHFT